MKCLIVFAINRFCSSAIQFIGRHLGKPDHPLVGLAQRNTLKLAALYEQVIQQISLILATYC